MVFFDLNIPYLEKGDPSTAANASNKSTRLKLTVKAMELGYAGVAYNRPIKGVISDADRCSISLFTLSSLLKAAPALSTAVRFHRELLGVPLDAPFRQCTRVTVAVDNAISAAALNSANPVLKTYDLVAARPLNQIAFDQTCKVSEVDLISIDFSQKLPFRLKLPMVKAATERGIYFEITYSHLISHLNTRRQMLTGAKLLVDWTRGKNLILSSAAANANELRGPCDVANLSTLLGLSVERAKAAISRNCSSLMANSLRKKHYYKEAIRVEKILPDELLNNEAAWFAACHNWDPISSGEGDLMPFDERAQSLPYANKATHEPRGSDLVSAVVKWPLDSTPLDFQISTVQGISCSMIDQSLDLKVESSYDVLANTEYSENLNTEDTTSMAGISKKDQNFGEDVLISLNDTLVSSSTMACDPFAACNEVPKISFKTQLLSISAEMSPDEEPSWCGISSGESDLLPINGAATISSVVKDMSDKIIECSSGAEFNSLHDEVPLDGRSSLVSVACGEGTGTPLTSKLSVDSNVFINHAERLNSTPFSSTVSDTPMEEFLLGGQVVEKKVDLALLDPHSHETPAKSVSAEHGEGEVLSTNDMTVLDAFEEMEDQEPRCFNDVPLEQNPITLMEQGHEVLAGENSHEPNSGKSRFKRRFSNSASPLPFKGLLKPFLVRKKGCRLKKIKKYHVRVNPHY
ncbi:hypothetical protein QJS10_CPB20g00788 [Acorus calamus]|uniref:Uncharacterized protein n=1 Tax=Acorus calamus TaxID=4465 RepID=A0AAV9CF98_ACOCL|nr:hypothetical protein QJS10_CPB20g00788 [Acorus calamus]